jgi:acetylornithine deacetylase
VVPLGDVGAWSSDPFSGDVSGGRVFGRGSCDMQGGLGTFATLQRGYRGDVAVVAEPTSLAVLPVCAGALTFRLTVRGRAAQASLRNEGVDVLDSYLLIHQALRRLEAARNVEPHPLMSR